MNGNEPALGEADYMDWLADLRDDPGACEAAVPVTVTGTAEIGDPPDFHVVTDTLTWQECGAPVAAVYDYECPAGHVKRRETCAEHEPVPGHVGCRECWEAGTDRPMRFTKIAGPGRTMTEAEYRAWLEWKQPQIAAELTECLPQEVRDAGMRVEWSPDGQPVAADGLPVAIPKRNVLGDKQAHPESGGIQMCFCGPGCTALPIEPLDAHDHFCLIWDWAMANGKISPAERLSQLDGAARDLGLSSEEIQREAVDRRLGFPCWAPFRDSIPRRRAILCYSLPSGSKVHVKPGCKCPR